MRTISIKEQWLLWALGIIVLLSPIAARAADSSQPTLVVNPIALAVPLCPAITVVTCGPANTQDKVLVVIPEAGGLLGIARLSGGI